MKNLEIKVAFLLGKSVQEMYIGGENGTGPHIKNRSGHSKPEISVICQIVRFSEHDQSN